MDTSSIVALAGVGLSLLVGNGVVNKLVLSSFRESMRETFLTKESAGERFVSKEEATAYATQADIQRVEAQGITARQEMWERITDHIIAPLNKISDRIDDLFKMLGQTHVG